jgi:hypothetical protein
MNTRLSRFVCGIGMLVSGCAYGQADIYWVGGAQGSWDDPENWDQGSVPTCFDAVFFDVIEIDEQVRVDVPTGSWFRTLDVLSGNVVLDMGPDAAFFSSPKKETCKDGGFFQVTIGGEGQIAELRLEGGMLAKGAENRPVIEIEVQIRGDSNSMSRFVLADGIIAGELSDDTHGYAVSMTARDEGFAQFEIQSDIDLHGFVIFGDYFQDFPLSTQLVVSQEVAFSASEIDNVAEVLVEHGAMVDLYELSGGNVLLGEGSLLSVEGNATADKLVLSEDAEVQASWVSAQPIEVLDSSARVSASRVGGWFLFPVSGLDKESEPRLILSDVAHDGEIEASIISLTDDLPEIGSVIQLVEYENLFDSGTHRASGEPSDRPELMDFQFYLSRRFDWNRRTYFIANDREGAQLLVGSEYMSDADLNFDGRVDFFDIVVFIEHYRNGSPWANFDRVHGVNRDDITAYINEVIR